MSYDDVAKNYKRPDESPTGPDDVTGSKSDFTEGQMTAPVFTKLIYEGGVELLKNDTNATSASKIFASVITSGVALAIAHI